MAKPVTIFNNFSSGCQTSKAFAPSEFKMAFSFALTGWIMATIAKIINKTRR